MSLEVKNLTFSFDGSHLFKDLNFHLKKNAVSLISGSSGVGKSTLLNIIAGLIKPNIGYIKLDSRILNDKKIFIEPENRNIGYVFQDFALFPHINAEKNMKYALSNDFHSSYEEIINTLNLQDHLKKMPHEMSGGQQQRVAIARSILMKPSLLILDEPFSNLDKENASNAQSLIAKIVKDLNIPCILVTHDSNNLNFLKISEEITLN
tara:strand:- start:463 stop:1083 length:621 start_codon:yes stop_codon:yes gene_type:complete